MTKAVVKPKDPLMLWYTPQLVKDHLYDALEVSFALELVIRVKYTSLDGAEEQLHPSSIVTVWSGHHERNMQLPQHTDEPWIPRVGSTIVNYAAIHAPVLTLFVKMLNQFSDV